MTPNDVIEEKKDAVKQQFDTLKAEQTEKQARVEEIEQELLRLQGEWRVLESLGQPAEEVLPPDPKRNTDPLTITATEDVDKDNKKEGK